MNHSLKFLLVEDEAVIAMHMELELGERGYQVAGQVTTGEEAIQSAKLTHSDVILMDIRLAGKIDGIEAASIIKSESDVPIIFLTGYDDPSLRERAEKIKPLAFLIKPLQFEKLETVLSRHFI